MRVFLFVAVLILTSCDVIDTWMTNDKLSIEPIPITNVKNFRGASSDEVFFVSTFEHDDPTNSLWWTGNIGIQQASLSSARWYSMFVNSVDAGLLSLVDTQIPTDSYVIEFAGSSGYNRHEANQYGLVFNFVDASNYSLFFVNGYGHYAIGYFEKWIWYPLREGYLQEVNLLNRTFQLSVTVSKGGIKPSVNDKLLPPIRFPVQFNGRHGIYLGSLVSDTASLLVDEYSVELRD